MDAITLALAKKYTEETVKGAGALKGANCTIESIEAVPEGNKVTFEWTLTDGSQKTDFIIIKDGVDGKDGKDGIDGIDGEKGDKGDQGDKGIGIESITKKSSAGLVDTYQIVFTDGTESSFDVVNGANITKTSQLENDSNFITNVVNNLLNYYTKDEVYTKANIDELLRNVGAGLSVKIVTVLPTEEISGTTIYLIKTSGNNYNQYMWIDNAWENLGSTTVDLSNYYTKDKVDEILLGYVTKDVLASILIDYVKKSELARVATSNDYNDLDNLPQIPDVSGIKPYTNVLQDSENTAPTSKALYDAVSGINLEVEKKAKSSDVGNISELSTTDKSSAVAAINEINDSLVDINRMKIYTNVKQLGLESECSTVDIFKAMPNNSLAIIGTFPIVSDEYCKLIDKPIQNYEGLLTIVKFNHARFSIEYKLSGGDTEYPNRMYVGNFAGSNPTTIDWKELATMDKVNALHKETTGCITGSLLGSVVKNANLYYQKFGDSRLIINGWVSIDAVTKKTPIFTLPNNWKANSNYLLPCYVENSNVACACMINITEGTVNSYTPLPATRELRFCGEIYLM